MKILAIETSCDETSISVLEAQTKNKIEVRSNVISSQIKLHAKFGGVVPHLAAREHVKNIDHVLKTALKEAKIKNLKDINLIVVTRGPGLGPALLVGLTFARTLSWNYDIPLIGTNHLDGHVHSNWLRTKEQKESIQDLSDKEIFPALNLVVSGGHTELVLMKNHGQYKIIGETLDDAIGEAFDKVARLLGLGYPGGPIVSRYTEKGDPEKYPLPSPMIKSKDYNFSYSGLKTAVLYLLKDLKATSPSLFTKGKPSEELIADISASFQKAAIEVLIHKTVRAAKEFKAKTILLSGGVSANKLLRQRLSEEALKAGVKYSQPAMEFTTDNAAMIGIAGYFQSLNKKTGDFSSVEMDANLNL